MRKDLTILRDRRFGLLFAARTASVLGSAFRTGGVGLLISAGVTALASVAALCSPGVRGGGRRV